MELETNQNNTNEKIGKVLRQFLDPRFKVQNNVDLNKFFTHFLGNGGKDNATSLDKQLTDQFCQWIIAASNMWEKRKINPPVTILSFALNLTAQLSSDEHIFVNLNSKNVYESLLVAQRSSPKDPNVIHGTITLLCSCLEHKNGVQWMMATTYWNDVINLGLTAPTTDIRKQAYEFITMLLEKTIGFNRYFAVNLVGVLLKPLKDVCRSLPNDSMDDSTTQIPDEELFEPLKPTLEFISEVTSAALKTCNAKILQLFLEQNTKELVEQILLFTEGEDLSYELLKVLFVVLFCKRYDKADKVKLEANDSLAVCDVQTMFYLIQNEMDKNNVRCIIKLCHYAHEIYSVFAPGMPLCVRKGEVIEFQNQMILFQVMPIMIVCLSMFFGKGNTVKDLVVNDEFRRNFVLKLLKKAAIKSIEIAFTWRDKLLVKPDLMEDATLSLEYLVKAKHLLNKERAASMFPCFVYSLNDGLLVITKMMDVDFTSRCTNYLCTLVDTIVDFVESFNLTWNDTIETIRVMDIACDFLQYSKWEKKIIVIKGLKLLNTAISKYMSPDMVLLTYSTNGSTVSQSGGLLYNKCHDSCWEVRDSALEVVHTLSLSANTKFPALTNVLLDAELPQLVVQMALKDDEFTVRTTAVRCLQELVQIQDIWDVLLGVNKFLDNMLDILENDNEAIVRREAAELITKIYKHQSFPDRLLLRLYDVMIYATVRDSYWEVRYRSVLFWARMWRIHLDNEGLIDNMFPTHTFSKELKKIVALNEAEVKKRIIKVLNQLSQIGCLYAIKCAVLDDDFRVFQRGYDFSTKVLRLFKNYKVYSENVDLNEPDTRYQELLEPASPASSTTMTAYSPADLGNPDSPQFDNPEYVDPFSPFPFSSSIDLTPKTSIHSSSDNLNGQSVTVKSSHSSNHVSPQFSPFPFSSSIDLTPKTSIHSSSDNLNGQSVTVKSSHSSNHVSPQSDDQTSPQSHNISSISNQTQYGGSSYSQEALVQNLEYDPLYYSPMTDQDISTINLVEMFEMLGGGDNFEKEQLQHTVNSNRSDQENGENLLEELLNSNDVKPLQGVYNPTSQITSHTPQVKMKRYLAPAQFVNFVYNEAETHAMKREQREKRLNEFDLVLDKILNEL